MTTSWQERATQEIATIKPHWRDRYGWSCRVESHEGAIDLYVHFARRDQEGHTKEYLLRLRYQDDFETAGRRETFVNPANPSEEGREFWPVGDAFKVGETPPAICLEGTFGFHSKLHRDRDGRRANLNKLLMETQRCLNK